MKTKYIALLLAASMAASLLCACGDSGSEGNASSGQQGKYSDITTLLDDGDYEGAIARIVGMAKEARAGESDPENSPEAGIRAILEGGTFSDVTGNYQITLSAAGAGTLNDAPITWEVSNWDDASKEGFIGYSEDGTAYASMDLIYANDCYALRAFLDDEVRYLSREGELHSAAITDDNWQEYFELRDYGYCSFDSFGDLSDVYQGSECALKPEYQNGFLTGEVSFSIYYSDMALISLQYDIDNDEYQISDYTGDASSYYVDPKEKRTVVCDFTEWDLNNDHGEDGNVFPMSISQGGWYYNNDTELGYETLDGNMATRIGYTFKNTEIRRATGTIYWLSK